MNKLSSKYFLIISLLIILIGIGAVSATENTPLDSVETDYISVQQTSDMDNMGNTFDNNNFKNIKTENDETNQISYISPNATLDGDGSKENPINISVAFNKTNSANKNTFTLLEGEYNIKKAISLNKSMAKDIIIQSEGNVTINGLNNINIFDIKTDNTVTIKNITFKDAYSTNNGAAIINAANLTIQDSSFINNKASSGGAIYNNKGNLTIINTSFIENEATGSGTSGYGGAIHTSGNISIINSTFSNNKASKGGVLYNNKAVVTIDSNNLFENNYALWAGTIYNYQATLNILNNNTIINSTTKNYAGVIHNEKGNVTIKTKNQFYNNNGFTSGGIITSTLGNIEIDDNNLFVNNTATYGGVINSTGNITITNNNIFENNTALYSGAVIYTNRGQLNIDNNTFNNNKANYYAGSIYLWNAKANIINTIFNNNQAPDGGVLYINNNCTDINLNQLQFNNNTATTGGSVYSHSNLTISNVNITNGSAQNGGAIYTTSSSTIQISKSKFENIYSENETLNLQGENLFFANTYTNSSMILKKYTLELTNPKESYLTDEEIPLEIQAELENPGYYDTNLLENDEYQIYANNEQQSYTNDNIKIKSPGNYSIYAISKIIGQSNILENIIITEQNDENTVLNNINITSNSGNLLVNQQNTISINITKNNPNNINITTTIDDNSQITTLDEETGEQIINIQYTPKTNGEKNIKIEASYANATTETLYEGTITAYYNGYMGKSFTGGENFTTKRSYEGMNSLILNPFVFYQSSNWNEFTVEYDALSSGVVDADKIVDVLYYQGYNWNKGLNITVNINNQTSTIIGQYDDSKGFASYNYPSGVVVYNLTGGFEAGAVNNISVVPVGSNSNALYGGLLVIVYANNSVETTILINEGADLLNPESSGFGANSSNTVAYSNYAGLDEGSAVLYVVSAASEKVGESNILVNGKEYASLADNYDSTSRLSVVECDVDNLVEGDNLVTLQSINDNLFAMGTILVISQPEEEPELTVDNITANYGDTVTLKATITNTDKQINGGKVVFKINGKTLKDENGKIIYVKLVNNTAEINYTIPTNMNKNELTIEAVYSGSSTFKSLRSQKSTITLLDKSVNIQMENIQANKDDTIVIAAKITESDKNINTGKVVFKINGKTLKDTNGKTIYANVINGTVSIEYDLTNLKARNYTISCIFTSNQYERTEQTATLTINK